MRSSHPTLAADVPHVSLGYAARGSEVVPLGKKIQVSLTQEELERLKALAAKRDVNVSDLVRQAIRQVYMSDLERDLGIREVHRVGETPLLIVEEEEIGIKGPEVLAQREGDV